MENRRLKSKLTSVGAEHEAAIEIAESLTKAIEKKHSEVDDLKKNKIEIEEKLLVLDIQVSYITYTSMHVHYMHSNLNCCHYYVLYDVEFLLVRCKEKFVKSSGSFGNTSHSTYVAAVG